MLGWANLLGILVGWGSPNIRVWVKLLKYYSGIVISYEPVGSCLLYELCLPPWDILYSETWSPVGLQLVVYIPPGSKLIYSELVVSLLRGTLAVPPSKSCPKFPPPLSGKFLTYPSRATLSVTLSCECPTLNRQYEISWPCLKAKGDNNVENKLEGLVGLIIFIMSTLSLLHVIEFSNFLLTSPSWDLINFLNDYSFLSCIFLLCAMKHHRLQWSFALPE